MNSDILHWLLAQLGPDTDTDDLAARYDRLHSARAVADEVLRERIATLIAEPLKVTVNGVATIDNSANATALERRLEYLQDSRAPDVTEADSLITVQLRARSRR
ncbi:hypothetical protein [Streptomyces violascens]|uniref:Uncharacterized protein n=1 Tax=Streptomyces violascens TaxID=67381 RepID=A0ABQ3QV04_9ACTN|nr:hypothetical protein [Streptomyces violascens]GHI41112.1 hypothetical protein Sviol_55200 [Streptomyces violascens]